MGRLLTAAAALRGMGAAAVVVSLARSGSLAVTPAGPWRVSHERVHGNPVGAGDALVAGLALSVVSGTVGVREVAGRGLATGEADLDVAATPGQQIRVRRVGGQRT